MKYINPMLPLFISGIAADPLQETWRFVLILGCCICSYAIGRSQGEEL